MAARLEKGQPLTYEQKLHLFRLIKENPNILNKSSDHFKLGQKAAAWEKVTKDYNTAFPVSQAKSTMQLKRAWEYIQNRVKKIQSTYIRKCHITGGGPPPTPPKPDELTLLAESIMENDLQPAKEQLDTEDIDSGLQLLKDDGTFTGEDTVVIDIPEGDMEMLSFSPSGKVPMEQESLLLQDLSTIIAKEDHVESSSTLPSTSSSSPVIDNNSVKKKIREKEKFHMKNQ
ncbi:hypothetical protein Pmani_024135 [Petrolisthes manimaculis]|uniref:Regulatory protein zeste n=1 Tax=Petrolisthes manimaculis TaxID=1843537 RepID=A0AAE1P863_9EUCA|nr:hypothetical protein Pmani_024135 [Petrolisthes manimaculis]